MGNLSGLESGSITLLSRAAGALLTYAHYLRKTFVPTGLSAVYPELGNDVSMTAASGAVVLVAVISALAWRFRERCPYLIFGWLWYLITLAPALDLLHVDGQGMADQNSYLPQIGLLIALSWGAADLTRHWQFRGVLLGSGAALLLFVFMRLSWLQAELWQSGESLWGQALAVAPRNPLAHDFLASYYARQGQHDEALDHYELALRDNPDLFFAHFNLANLLAQHGEPDKAVEHFQAAIKIDPRSALAHHDLAAVFIGQGRLDDATQHLKISLEIDPRLAKSHHDLAIVLASQGRIDDALARFERALQIEPDYADAHNSYGALLFRLDKLDDAAAEYEKALQLRPDFTDAHLNMGRLLISQGHNGDAEAHYRTILQARPADAAAHAGLAAALTRLGKLDSAISHYLEALQLQPHSPETHYNLGLALQLKKRTREAIGHWREAIRLEPARVAFLHRLAVVLATSADPAMRDGREAVALAERAQEISGKQDPALLDALAAAYAEDGQFDKAVSAAEQALALAEAEGNPEMAASVSSRLSLYRTGAPYHDSR